MCVCIYSLVKISNFVNQGSLPSDAKNQSLKLCAVDGVDLVSNFFFLQIFPCRIAVAMLSSITTRPELHRASHLICRATL